MPDYDIVHVAYEEKTGLCVDICNYNRTYLNGIHFIASSGMDAIYTAHTSFALGMTVTFDRNYYNLTTGVYEVKNTNSPYTSYLVPIAIDDVQLVGIDAVKLADSMVKTHRQIKTQAAVVAATKYGNGPSGHKGFSAKGLGLGNNYYIGSKPAYWGPPPKVNDIKSNRDVDYVTERLMQSALPTNGGKQCKQCGSTNHSFVGMSLICKDCKAFVGGC
jgi:hypothetical protein